jgi:hypothetical protein
MKPARYRPRLRTPMAVTLAAGCLVGCNLLQLPSAPQAPQIKAPEVKAPDLKAPDLEAPDLKAPDVSLELPEDPPANRTCCFRNAGAVAKVCAGKARCCTGLYERGVCEDAGGLWFNSAEGCAGAC